VVKIASFFKSVKNTSQNGPVFFTIYHIAEIISFCWAIKQYISLDLSYCDRLFRILVCVNAISCLFFCVLYTVKDRYGDVKLDDASDDDSESDTSEDEDAEVGYENCVKFSHV
jgi:hypothetical protein